MTTPQSFHTRQLFYGFHTVPHSSRMDDRALSLAGLLFPMATYPSEDLRQSFIANDVVNLLIGLPVLLGALWFARRGKLLGLLALPWRVVLPDLQRDCLRRRHAADLAIFCQPRVGGLERGLPSFLLVSRRGWGGGAGRGFKVAWQNGSVRGYWWDSAPCSSCAPWGKFFDGTAGMAEFGVLVADGLTTPFWIIGGLYLWRRQPLGYIGGAGLLFQASMLFVGLLVFFILRPFVAGVPFPLVDFVAILVMSLFSFVPFGLFVRGILSDGRSAPG